VFHVTPGDKVVHPASSRLWRSWSNRVVSSDYPLAPALLVRLMGAALVLAGAVVLVVLGLGVLLDWSSTVLAVTVVLAAFGVLVAAVASRRLAPVVHLDDAGYEVRWVRGAGVRQGRWTDVEDVVATTVADGRCVVLRRRDGTTTTVPVDILRGTPEEFVQDLREHLNRGHGYRPVR
jgi:hypothetical protein